MKLLLKIAVVIVLFTVSAQAQNLYNDSTVLEIRLEFAQPDWKDRLQKNIPTETDIPAAIIVAGQRYDSIGVRYKGNSSMNIPGDKKPFNISMDTYRPDQHLWGYKTLNLNNCFKDPTLTREIIGYHIASKYLPGAKTAFVKLFINNEYWGVYLHVQQLNKTFLREAFGNADGNHYKLDPRGDLTWLGVDTIKYRNAYELKTNEEKNDWSDLVGFIEKLNKLPPNQFANDIYAVLDVDRALWYIAFCNLCVNLDSYIGSGHNAYLYHNPVDDRFHIIPWDLNEVLGTFGMQMTIPQREQLDIYYNQVNQMRPLVSKLFTVSDFRSRYAAHLRTMLKEVFSAEYWQPRIQFYQDLIRADLAADTKKLYTMDMFNANVYNEVQTGPGPGGGSIPGILPFINNRRAYLKNVPDLNQTQAVISIPTHTPAQPVAGETAQIFVDATGAGIVNLWWSANGKAFVRQQMNFAGNNRYEDVIPPHTAGTNIRYYIEAKTTAGAASYQPERAENEYFSYIVAVKKRPCPVVINELMAGNTKTIKDPQGQYADWVELYNRSAAPYDLSGAYLSDNFSQFRKWRFPDGTVIQPNDYLIIWADQDTLDTPGLHANFRLAKTGEGLYMFDTDKNENALLDSTTYGPLADEVTWGRIPNGDGPFEALYAPTPLARNERATNTEAIPPAHSIELYCYPNPVTGNTATIYVSLPNSAFATLHIYNALGTEVQSLPAGLLNAGNHIYKIQTDNLPNGAYFYTLTTPSDYIRKMFIVAR